MLGIFVKFMILLVALKTLRNTFPTNVSLGIVSSYAKGVYNYYDVQQIEEFIAFKGAFEIASLIEKYDATLYKSKFFAILEYCYENYASNTYVKPYIEVSSTIQEETNILQECMVEEIDETVSSLDEKYDEESEEQK